MPDPIRPPDDALGEQLEPVLDRLPTAPAEPVPVEIGADGTMYVRGQLLVLGEDAQARLRDIEPEAAQVRTYGEWEQVDGLRDPIRTLTILREEGHVAQLNHVFSTSSCSCPCPPHPSLASRVSSEGLAGLLGQPFRSQPFRSQPFRSQPFRSQPFRSQSQPPMSTARPAPGPSMSTRRFGAGTRLRPLVIVLDTGIASPLPALLTPGALGGPDDPVVFGQTDEPDVIGNPAPDGYLDPVAGHGTFIAGVVQQLAPGCPQLHVKIADGLGRVEETTLFDVLDLVPAIVALIDRDVIVSMSFGGPTVDLPVFLEGVTGAAAAAIGSTADGAETGVALVGAAGNDGTCVPYYPAAWPTVVGVGGVGPDGPPEWTNYGDWVDACAPAIDLVSCFFTFNGNLPSINGVDVDDFAGWAYWSGTSFAVPCVVAALGRSIAIDGRTAPDAIRHTIRASHLARITHLGTVVNV